MPDKPEVQRIHTPGPPEKQPDEGGPAKSHYDFRAEHGDAVRALQDPDGTWRWQLFGANGKLKLEQGNLASRDDAMRTAREAHGDAPAYQDEEE